MKVTKKVFVVFVGVDSRTASRTPYVVVNAKNEAGCLVTTAFIARRAKAAYVLLWWGRAFPVACRHGLLKAGG